MIHHDTFLKGEEVEFQDFRRCWIRGTVQAVEPRDTKIEGPNGTLVETHPGAVHVLFSDSVKRALRVVRLNPKRVRRVAS